MSLKQGGHAMRTFDSPFYRSTVGFDQLSSMLDQVNGDEGAVAPGYPPYNRPVRLRGTENRHKDFTSPQMPRGTDRWLRDGR